MIISKCVVCGHNYNHHNKHQMLKQKLFQNYIKYRAEPIIGSATRFDRVSATLQYSVIGRYKPAKPSIKIFLV